jgi:hypothetical protein
MQCHLLRVVPGPYTDYVLTNRVFVHNVLGMRLLMNDHTNIVNVLPAD